jgi:hypothetical protein
VRRNTSVWVLTSAAVFFALFATGVAASPGSFPKCKPSAYTYDAGLNGAEGTLVLQAALVYRSGPTCRLEDRVVVRLADARGHLLRVKGNPAHLVVDAIIGPRRVIGFRGVLLGWHNWCAQRPSAFSFRVVSATKTAEFHWSQETPVCIDPAQPSVLRRFTHRG